MPDEDRRHHDDPGSSDTGSDRSSDELDDDLDREELRDRYYGLLQELRVLLPGVQILVAFLLTVAFATGFDKVDDLGRDLYGVALVSGILAVVAFTTPAAFHRIGRRQSRSERLAWSITTTRLGLALFALSLLAALTVVARVVFTPSITVVAVAIVLIAMVGLWVVLPVVASRRTNR